MKWCRAMSKDPLDEIILYCFVCTFVHSQGHTVLYLKNQICREYMFVYQTTVQVEITIQ